MRDHHMDVKCIIWQILVASYANVHIGWTMVTWWTETWQKSDHVWYTCHWRNFYTFWRIDQWAYDVISKYSRASCNVQFEVCEWAHKMHADFKIMLLNRFGIIESVGLVGAIILYVSEGRGGGAILTNVHTIHRESCWGLIGVGQFMKFMSPSLAVP